MHIIYLPVDTLKNRKTNKSNIITVYSHELLILHRVPFRICTFI